MLIFATLKLSMKINFPSIFQVTADGSIDFINAPEEQERGTSQLHYCEIICALHILSPGGSLVVKMFTLFEATSASMLFLLNCVFKEVRIRSIQQSINQLMQK